MDDKELLKFMKENTEKRKKTVFINTWSTECGNCDRGADYEEKTHKTVLSYGRQGKGCGVKWKYLSSHYSKDIIKDELLSKLRPDLIIDRNII
jgi:hypothetical protein